MSRPQQRKRTAASVAFHLGEPLVRDRLSQIWWVMLLRAAAAVVFGGLVLGWPRHTAFVLVGLFGVYALIDGFTTLIASVRRKSLRVRWRLTLASATDIAAGTFAFTRPRLMALMLIAVMGVWLIVRGVTEIASKPPIRVSGPRAENRRHWSVIVNGAMSALFGAGLIATPRIGALSLIWAIGAWAITHGLLMVPFALELRRAARTPRQDSSA